MSKINIAPDEPPSIQTFLHNFHHGSFIQLDLIRILGDEIINADVLGIWKE
jgi:hypothetical protein